ncbi:FAD-dependent monooxygenase [Tunturiibacter lichenicola]|uniref:FAD-dependent monooxygenase n=1 Tax=Tunturiibacter lichenicola TaxID=2051959 RepID=UPI0021B2178B|nr:FAD-dependent monooxygenase [Edaphobacter lichenicola]
MYEKPILIIGAGPTGLTLAIDLARRGIAFRLLEAAETPFQGSRGKGIQPRTLEVFEDLGVIDQILAAGAPYPKFRLHLGPLSLRAGSLGSSKPPTEAMPYPNLWMVPQSRTEEILRERLRQLGHQVEFGMALTKLEQDDHAVHATLSNGEIVDADYLVGCDGGHSAVRKSLGLKLEGEAIDEEPSLVADVEIKGLDRRDWHIWPSLKGGAIGLCPLPNTQLFQLMAKAASIGDNIEQVVLKATRQRIERIAWRSIYQPSVRMVNRYRVGRVFLAGDAAHVHPPSGGQGLNTGVQDAYNLGWKLAHVVSGGPSSLLDTYESERLPIAAAVLGLSKHLHQTRSIKRGDATKQLALHYRTSPLSSGDPLGTLHPGDRMPDRRIGDTRLFERMRGPQATELQLIDGPRILIRPDGYIASIRHNESTEYAGMPIQHIRCTTIPSLD